MRKEERHQIKRDELVTIFERAEFFLAHNARRVLALIGVGAALVVALVGVRAWHGASEEKASLALSEVIQAYRAPVVVSPEALQQIPPGAKSFATSEERARKVIELADGVLAGGSGTEAAPKALFYKGLALDDLGKREEASAALQDLVMKHPHDFLAAVARFKLAQIKESQKNPSEALVHYQALLEERTGDFPAEEALMGIARCQEDLGRREEARATYRRILDQYPDSDYRPEARRKVDELS